MTVPMEVFTPSPAGTPPKPAHRDDSSSKKLLKDQLALVDAKTADGGTRKEIARFEDDLTFDKGFFLTIRAIQLLKSNSQGRPILVGLAGPSGAGKSVFCDKIREFMPGVCVLTMDMYNDASMLVEGNFDDPRLTDYDTLNQNLSDLKAGKTVEVPIYDFKQSKRVGYRTQESPASNVIIIEGIYALSDKLRPLQDLRVSISGGVHFDLVKRVMRDIDRSGQEPEDIIHQISETVYPMYKAFIEPDLRSAHLRVVNSFNPFAGFQDPTYIIKSTKVVEEEDVRSVLSDEYTSSDEQETTDIYLLPPNEDPETCTSWLRMRNRNGRYTLMFEETVCDGDVMISPRIKFEVGVRILGGLMALGYEVGAIMKRRSRSYSDEMLEVKIDWIEGLDRSFTQIQGKVRAAVEEAGTKLGLDGSYVPHSYIEQVQLEEMTEELRNLTEEMKDKFVMAANRSSMDIPHMERSGSGFGLGAIRSRLERAGRSESVTRLQDAVRKRRSERADGTGSGQWGSQGEVFADAAAQAAALGSPRPPSSQGRRRPPIDRAPGSKVKDPRPPSSPRSGINGDARAHHVFNGDSAANGFSAGGDESGEHSGGSDQDGGYGFANVARTQSPYRPEAHVGGVNMNAPLGAFEPLHVAALESRMHMLSQRVDDIAQAHLRSVSAMGSPGGGVHDASSAASTSQLQAQAATINSLMQSQMMLTAKIDALANATKMNDGEGRMGMYLAAAGGAAAAMLALRLFDSPR